MRLAVRRVPAILLVLVLTVASMAPVTAQSSDTVMVTGDIVAAPLSISIPDQVIKFGSIDYRATTQTGTPWAKGFLMEPDNGAIWISETPVSITVSSPATWTSHVCVETSTGLLATRFRIFNGMPADSGAVETALSGLFGMVAENCNTPQAWLPSQSLGANLTFNRYLGAWVMSTDATGSMTATIKFTVSLGG